MAGVTEPTPGLRDRMEQMLRQRARGGEGLGFNADMHEEAVVAAILADPAIRAALAASPAPGPRKSPFRDADEHELQSAAGTHLFDTSCYWCLLDWLRQRLDAAVRERDELREDAEKWRAAEAEGHIVDFTETGFGLQHPPSCRPNLIGCEFNQWLSRADGPDMEPGRYRMTWDPDMNEQWPLYAALHPEAGT